MVRVLYVDNEPSYRGGQQVLLDLMEGMLERGRRLWLAAPPGAPLSKKAAEAGIATLDLPQRHEISPAGLIRISRLVRACRCDLVYCNTPRGLLAAGLAARWANRLVVAGRRSVYPLRSALSALKYNRLADCTVVVSDAVRRQLVKDGVEGSRIERIYDGVDVGRIDAQPKGALQWSGNSPVVAVVAALTSEKGHATLFEAASLLQAQGIQARWLLIGDGPLRTSLEDLVRQSGLGSLVRFTGFRNDSLALLKCADLLCLPSFSEGLSSAILEAMACRLPVAASRVGGVPELIVDGTTGMLVEPGNAAELASRLNRLLTDASLRNRMGEAGRLRVEQHFTCHQMVQQTESVYSRLLADR